MYRSNLQSVFWVGLRALNLGDEEAVGFGDGSFERALVSSIVTFQFSAIFTRF